MKIRLIEVPCDKGTMNHVGKLYYFEESEDVSSFAKSLAVDISNIERVYPKFIHLNQYESIDIAIWIVSNNVHKNDEKISGKSDNQSKSQNTISQIVKNIVSTNTSTVKSEKSEIAYDYCPKCKVLVRASRLVRHIKEVHGITSLNNKLKVSYYGGIRDNQSKQDKGATEKTQLYEERSISNNFAMERFKNRCRYCGKPAIPGDNICYNCNMS